MAQDTSNTHASGNVTIPVIDFSLFASNPEECARQVGEASQNIGFFYLKNHGLPQDLIDKMFDASESFFQRPIDAKSKHMIGPDNTGYSPMKSET
jgi:isopenicillin N synthase-like dioxygenase